MKNIVTIVACAIIAGVITFTGAYVINDNNPIQVDAKNDSSILKQKILEYTDDARTYYNVYDRGSLIGSISDFNYVNKLIDAYYNEKYAESFPNTTMSFGEDIYISEEIAYYKLDNIDDKIFDYLVKYDGLGIMTNVVDFSTDEGVYATIYVKNIDDFNDARDSFLENFISSVEYHNLSNNIRPGELNEVGSQAIGFRVQEDIVTYKGIANPKKIMTSKDEVLDYLCFGDNKERVYHTVVEGETLQGVGFNYKDMTPTQIMLLNPDKITSTDQILEPGMLLNVTYFTSPITVVVTKERLAVEDVYPQSPLYVEDVTLYQGSSQVIQEEKPGSEYALYEETWVNGYLVRGVKKSTSTIVQPTQGVIKVGTKSKPNIGTGTFRWPISNVSITCLWGCYYGHQAIDLQNMYNRYDDVFAADNGTVVENSYDDISGYYIVLDHNNGYQTYYGHLYQRSPRKIGETVIKGEYIGDIGMSGLASGPHVHFEIRTNGVKKNPCDFMNCGTVVIR